MWSVRLNVNDIWGVLFTDVSAYVATHGDANVQPICRAYIFSIEWSYISSNKSAIIKSFAAAIFIAIYSTIQHPI